ncbi:hypothetical protein Salat_2942600 [Sesamum alatum]|uniref:Uncharacterized protein n=1 Tax=Sesamum alatum TaxID=300844 RepID=A0AAE2C8H1_9LAMI|nr:hypothetical protein Salat_2942600 [Sesamum alatum]
MCEELGYNGVKTFYRIDMLRKFTLLLFETDLFQLFDGHERDVCIYLESALCDYGPKNTDGGHAVNENDGGHAVNEIDKRKGVVIRDNIIEEDSDFFDSDYNVDFDADDDSDDNNFDENIDHGVTDTDTTSSDSSGENGIEISEFPPEDQDTPLPQQQPDPEELTQQADAPPLTQPESHLS